MKSHYKFERKHFNKVDHYQRWIGWRKSPIYVMEMMINGIERRRFSLINFPKRNELQNNENLSIGYEWPFFLMHPWNSTRVEKIVRGLLISYFFSVGVTMKIFTHVFESCFGWNSMESTQIKTFFILSKGLFSVLKTSRLHNIVLSTTTMGVLTNYSIRTLSLDKYLKKSELDQESPL